MPTTAALGKVEAARQRLRAASSNLMAKHRGMQLLDVIHQASDEDDSLESLKQSRAVSLRRGMYQRL